jgi:hypothetical protein
MMLHPDQHGHSPSIYYYLSTSGIYLTTQLSYPVLRSKSSTHSMCVQKSSLHTYRTENGYRITNVLI